MQFATGGVVTASYVPDDPAAAYAALFPSTHWRSGLRSLIYLFAHDAKPHAVAKA